MHEHAVIIVGAGPTGMMLAAELALAGIDVALLERRSSYELIGSRAGGLHARTIELLDQRGVVDRFVAEGQKTPTVHFHVPLDISYLPTRHNYVLALWQNHFERILAGWINDLKVPVYRRADVIGLEQDADGVTVRLADGSVHHAAYLVGCDGGRSFVRKSAGIEFPGLDATTSWLIAELETSEEPKLGFHEDAIGKHAIGKVSETGPIRMVLVERQAGAAGEPTLKDVSEALIGIYGTDFGIHSPIWISRFTDMTRQAANYRQERILLAGDAAHVHPPVGGQGLNIGVHDAVNLGWKLAQVVKGHCPEDLLDTYHAERHPAAARVLRNTMAQVALRHTDPRSKALGDTVAELLALDEPRRTKAAEMSGLALRYDLGSGHPLLGRRMPDLDLITPTGPVRVFSLLHAARPVLLNFGRSGAVDIAPWRNLVTLINANCNGPWELPGIGAVAAPRAVLVRPDGYVAWVGEDNQTGLEEALITWFGSPNAA
jgi:3-(3-hydroxy-phenyl)propionate hydroxylase